MKKIIFKIVIILSCIVFVFLALGATMVFIPGANILGVKYVRATSGSVNVVKQRYAPEGSFKSVSVTADNIPIKLNFVQSYTYSVELNERYNGFSSYTGTPELTMEVVDGSLVFAAKEYKPFVYHNRLDEYGLIISVPVYYTGLVNVESRTSKITVGGLTGQTDTIKLKTTGLITLEDSLNTNNLEITSGGKWIKVSEKCTIKNNLTIKTTGGSAEVFAPVGGEINFSSSSGRLFFNSANSLVVNSKSGGVKPIEEGKGIVTGRAEITCGGAAKLTSAGSVVATTKNGDFTFGKAGQENSAEINVTTKNGSIKLLGKYKNENVTLKTKSGDVEIEKIDTVKITTTHGRVKLGSVINAEITAGSSGVEILDASESVSISTRGGYIRLGGWETEFNASVTAKTFGGDVKITNANGESVSVTTKSGKVNITNSTKNSTKYSITTKSGDVKLTDINGETTITTNAAVDVGVYKFNGKVTITAGNHKVNVSVSDPAVYYIESKGKKISVPAKKEKVKIYNTSITAKDDKNLLTVKSRKGKITISENF